MDWKDIAGPVGKYAPLLAGVLASTGVGMPAAAAVAAAGKLAAGVLGTDETPDAVAQALQTDPEAAVKLRQIDADHQRDLVQLQVQLQTNQLAAETARIQADAADRKSARDTNASRTAVWWIAIAILGTFALIMGAVLYGCFALLTGGMPIKDVAVVAAVSGLVGSVVGYVAANAQTVVNFIFGGSLGSEKKTDVLSASVAQAIDTLGTKP